VTTETPSATPATPTNPAWTRWLNPILAITGIAVGIFIIAAGLYLLFAQSSGCHSMMADPPPAAQSKDCCASMMKDMKMPMEKMPSMTPMPSMPSMPTPTPGR
jgi:hypothetical protein